MLRARAVPVLPLLSPPEVPGGCLGMPAGRDAPRGPVPVPAAGWPTGSPVRAQNTSPQGGIRPGTPATVKILLPLPGQPAGGRGSDARWGDPGKPPLLLPSRRVWGACECAPWQRRNCRSHRLFGELLGGTRGVSYIRSPAARRRGAPSPAGCAPSSPQESWDQKFSRGKTEFCDLVFTHAVLKY